MRPLELRLRNFRSYFGDDVAFDFRGRTLVGIVGPIGSGKSSILDAVAFALYGKTPSIGRSTKTLIHQRADHAAVALRFSVNDQVWEVVRSLRKKGQSQHALYRFEADTVDPVEVEKVVMEGEVNRRITELLGLEFDAFGRSVLLAQGRFADFLRAQPSERDKVLKGVFGHDRIDRMREVAKERARIADTEAEKVAFQVQQIELKAERLVAARSEMVALEQRVVALEKAEPELATLDQAVSEHMAQLERAERRRQLLLDLREDLPDVASSLALAEQAASSGEKREAATAALTEATTAVEAAEAAQAALDPDGVRGHIEQATVLLAAIEHARSSLGEAELRSGKAEAELTKAVGHRAVLDDQQAASAVAADEAAQRLAAATQHAEERRAELHAAEHGDMAATLRQSLSAGDDCPVCEQAVTTLPPPPADGQRLAAAREAEAEARREVAAATTAHNEAAARHRKIEAQLAAAAEERKRLETAATEAASGVRDAQERLAAATLELEQVTGRDVDPAEFIAGRRAELAASASGIADARKALDAARRNHDEAIEAEQKVHQVVAEHRVAVADISARLGVELESGDADQGFAGAVAALHARWEAEARSAQASIADARTAIDGYSQKREALLADLKLSAASLAEELGSTRARAEERSTEIKRLETELQSAEKLTVERDRLVGERDVMQRLAGDLTDSRFIRYLLDEERAVLGELGSEHFLRLTSGRYEFDTSGAFDIVDLTAAEAVRKPDSLSGGETFLASLALALALAEMVARTGGRLDAFFLDEGFGSLDPEHLDLAMEGIESLVAGDAARLVVVVSHVPEMRQRIEDLIVLDRSPTTGDTRVLHA